MQHVPQIKHALGVYAVASRESALVIQGNTNSRGSQVDLLIDRDDDIANVCEMKYLRSKGRMTSDYQDILHLRQEKMEKAFPVRRIIMTLVSTNPYDNANDEFLSVLSTEELFR